MQNFSKMSCRKVSHHLTAVEGFACPSDPGSYVVGGFMPLVGSPKANRLQAKDQTKGDSKAYHEEN